MILQWRDDNNDRIKILSPHNLNYHCAMHNKVFEKIVQPCNASQYICYVHNDSQFFMTEKLQKFPHDQYYIDDTILGCKSCLNNKISLFEEQQRNFAQQPAIEMTLNEHGAGRCPGCHVSFRALSKKRQSGVTDSCIVLEVRDSDLVLSHHCGQKLIVALNSFGMS